MSLGQGVHRRDAWREFRCSLNLDRNRNPCLLSISTQNLAIPIVKNVATDASNMSRTCDFVSNRNHRFNIMSQLLQVSQNII